MIALFILAFFACMAVYGYTDLTEHMAEQQRLESLPAPHRAGERGPVVVSQSSSLEQLTAETTAGATVFDWDADGMGDAA